MKCISIVAPRQWVHGGGPHGMGIPVAHVTNPYPDAEDGIVAHSDYKGNWNVRVGDKEVPVAFDLVWSEGGAVRHDNKYRIRIFHASVEQGPKGLLLVPATADDHGLLVLCDPSHGREGTVRLITADGAKSLVSGEQNYDLFVGFEQVALLHMPQGSSIAAVRESKRFIWFGASSVRESVHYRVDGASIQKMVTTS